MSRSNVTVQVIPRGVSGLYDERGNLLNPVNRGGRRKRPHDATAEPAGAGSDGPCGSSPDGNETLQQYIERHNIDPQTGLAREIEQPGWGLSDLPEMRTKPKVVNQGD
jgi:hypothetical protein